MDTEMGRLDAWTKAYPRTFRSCVGFAHGVSTLLTCHKGGLVSLSGSAKHITSFSKCAIPLHTPPYPSISLHTSPYLTIMCWLVDWLIV